MAICLQPEYLNKALIDLPLAAACAPTPPLSMLPRARGQPQQQKGAIPDNTGCGELRSRLSPLLLPCPSCAPGGMEKGERT